MLKKAIVIALFILAILGFGFFVPLDSYTTTKGCRTETMPTERLHLIFGDSLEDIKAGDVDPPLNEGCSANTKHKLYLF